MNIPIQDHSMNLGALVSAKEANNQIKDLETRISVLAQALREIKKSTNLLEIRKIAECANVGGSDE